MTQETTIQPYTDALRTPGPLDFKDVRRNTQLVKQALREVMVENVDYGKIPGCGDKPGLFKPGAEKLGLMFKLGCFPDCKNESENPDVIKYVTRTKVIHLPTGTEVCVGVGCASTDEEKYKWRRAVSHAEFEATPEERRRLKFYREATPTEQVRQNPADVENTVLKMSAKRSMVDAIVKATAATDIFAQGEDDIIIDIDEPRSGPKRPQAKAPDSPPTSTQATPVDPRPIPEGYVPMMAKFPSECLGCQGKIEKDTKMLYNRTTKKTLHGIDCFTA
jgi:hypothetical protein